MREGVKRGGVTEERGRTLNEGRGKEREEG